MTANVLQNNYCYFNYVIEGIDLFNNSKLTKTKSQDLVTRPEF